MSRLYVKRLTKELKDLQEPGGCPVGVKLLKADDMKEWTLSLEVLGESVYPQEMFCLRFRFTEQYPIDSPEVVFVTGNDEYQIPEHPHVYSNGHICILSTGWSPVLNVATVCISLQSMLASCKKKERPPDNARYVARAPSNAKSTRWDFHDDTV